MVFFHNIDFGVFWASWGGSGKEPASGNQSGSRFRYVSIGPDRFWGSEWFEVSLGSDEVSMSSDRFRVPKVVPGFEGFGVPGFDRFVIGSDRFEGFGFRWCSQGSGTMSCRRHVGPSSCHPGVGIMRLAMLCGKSLHFCKQGLSNILAVEDTTHAY